MSQLYPSKFNWAFIGSLACFFFPVACQKKEAPPPPPPPVVKTLTVHPTDVPIFEDWIGTLDGYVNAQIRAQVSGYLLTQNYIEGSEVKKGDLLFQIDPRPFQALLDDAEAKMMQDQAQSGKTALDVKRYTPLAKEQAISQEELDNAVQANLGAQAQLKSDASAIERAQLNLGFTRITSPIDGLAGRAQAQIGDLVGPSTNVLTTVSAIDPLKVYFQVNEQSYLTFWQKYVDPAAGGPELQLILSDNSFYPEKGKVIFIDRQISVTTGTLQIAGSFPNPKFLLRPGQYGRVRAQTETKKNVFLVPQRAVTELQGSYQMTVLDDDNKAHVRPVTVGQRLEKGWIIEKGLEDGTRVVVEGMDKAKEGVTVNPQPFEDPDKKGP